MANYISIEQLKAPHSSVGKYTHLLFTPMGVTLVAMLLAFGVFTLVFGNGSQKKIASGYWGSTKEIKAAKKKALEQISSPKCDSAALYIGVLPKKKKK
jgi:type IV secretory pathway TraG/TraD family ATPase VirD4